MAFKSFRQEESFLRADMYTPYGELSHEQKKHLKKIFVKLLVDLVIVEISIAAIYLFNQPFVGLAGIYFGISAFNGIRVYGSAVLGSGLHTVFLFFDNRLRIIDSFGGREISYRFLTDAVYFEKGLVMRFKDGGTAGISLEAMEQSEHRNDIIKLLTFLLKKKFKNEIDDPEYKQKKEDEGKLIDARRNEMLGFRMAEAIYEPDGKDLRDYCRLVMNTGVTKNILGVLFPVLLAFCVALPIFSFITGEYMLDAVMYILATVLVILFFVSKIGISAPAKARLSGKKHEVIKIYLHYDGISVKTPKKEEEMYLWKDVSSYRFHPDIGMSFDLGKDGTVFIPADIVEKEMAEAVIRRAESQSPKKGEKP